MPGDPFALPFTDNSDPLRGPVFVPLLVDCLRDDPMRPLFSGNYLATACCARRGLSHHLSVIDLYENIFIYLFICLVR